MFREWNTSRRGNIQPTHSASSTVVSENEDGGGGGVCKLKTADGDDHRLRGRGGGTADKRIDQTRHDDGHDDDDNHVLASHRQQYQPQPQNNNELRADNGNEHCKAWPERWHPPRPHYHHHQHQHQQHHHRQQQLRQHQHHSALGHIAKVLLLLPMLIAIIACQKDSRTLYIAGFFPTSRDIPQGAIGRGVLPAVRLALQHVNESPKFFTKYKLDLVWNNTKCDAAYGMKAFFRMLDEEPVKIILFGDACPAVTDPISKASKFFHLIQLSYADTFTATTANFFRIVPSEGSFNPARVNLLKHFNWNKVGTIYQNTPRYSLPHSALLTDLDNANVDIVASQSLVDELRPEMYLQKFKENDVRIILGNFAENWSKKIFCQAYREGIYGRRYQWIITGIYNEQWWRLDDGEAEELGCNEEELLLAIDGYIVTDVLTLSKNARTHNGFETSFYKSEYDRLRQNEYSRFHGYAYDGIWAIALAIENVDKKLKMRNSQLSIDNFQYRDPFWADLFREALNETSFNGVTGHVSFDKNERRGIILLQQFQSKKLMDIAQYYMATDELVLEENHIDWRGGLGPPVDRNTVVISPSRISLTLFIVISVFAIIGIVIAFVFLLMNIKYRNQRYIKMSSPYLNNLIIIGCILTYTSVILLGLNSGLTSESNFQYICAGRAWFLMTGFTLAFGSMFSKTWRVHAIFTDIKLNKKLIKDYKLFMIVGILVFIDVATLTTWQIIDPFYRDTSQGKPEPSPQNEDILVIPEMEYCQSRHMTIFLGSIYVYKGLLMIFGIFLAWETRHVSIPALNDSKYIGMSVYNVVIMCIIGVGLSFVLRDQQDAAFVIISIFIIFCSTATLCLVFVPKLIELKRNPNAGDRRVRGTLKPFKTSRRDSEEVEMHTKIKLLTEDNFRFRQRLKEKSYELEALTFRLRALEESVKQVKPSNEIVVEENDLRQMDKCDQRKLSVTNARQMNKRRKSSATKLCDENLVVKDEASSSEIIVNSTSIFSLSSEAAQLTIKNGSIVEMNGGGGGGNSSGGDSSSKSSDEMSITCRQQQQQQNASKANGDVFGKKNKKKDNKTMSIEGEQLSVTDSDDTSYAKAIKETINSEVITYVQSQVVQSRLPAYHHHHQHHHHHHHLEHICPVVDSGTTSPVVHPCCHHHHVHLHKQPQQPPEIKDQKPEEREQQQQQLECKLLPDGEVVRLPKTRRTQSFGGFLQHQYDELIPFQLQQLSAAGDPAGRPSMEVSPAVSLRHTSTSPVRTCSSIDNTLNLVHSSSSRETTSSASYVRLFPYLNRSVSIDHNQTLRSGQSCPQVRCDIVEYL